MINRNGNRRYTCNKKKVKAQLDQSTKKLIIRTGIGVIAAGTILTGIIGFCNRKTDWTYVDATEYSIEVIGKDVSEFDLGELSDETQSVVINDTNLTDVSELSGYDDIQKVNLENNLITDVNDLESLEKLGILDIQGNSISELNIENFENLRDLKIQGNYKLYSYELIDYCEKNNISIDITREDVAEIEQVKQILATLDLDGKTDLEKEKIIHDYVVNSMDYDMNASDTNDPEQLALIMEYNQHLLKYALEGKGVCANYAALFDAMLKLSDINSYVLHGRAKAGIFKTGPHAWNLVEIDGEYMLCDVTWDDNQSYDFLDQYGLFNKKYYNKTGNSADNFTDRHMELSEYVDKDKSKASNVRSSMAIESNIKDIDNKAEEKAEEVQLASDEEIEKVVTVTPDESLDDNNVTVESDTIKKESSVKKFIDKVEYFFENIDYSKIPVKEATKVILGLMATGSLVILSQRVKQDIKSIIRKKKDKQELMELPKKKDRKKTIEQKRVETEVKYEEPVQPIIKEEIKEESTHQLSEKEFKELPLDKQVEHFSTNEEKLDYLQNELDAAIVKAANEQIEMVNYKTWQGSSDLETVIQELISMKDLSRDERAFYRLTHNESGKEFKELPLDEQRTVLFVTKDQFYYVDKALDRYRDILLYMEVIRQRMAYDESYSKAI